MAGTSEKAMNKAWFFTIRKQVGTRNDSQSLKIRDQENDVSSFKMGGLG